MTIDLQRDPPDDVFLLVEGALGVELMRDTVAYGWSGKSAGFATKGERTWIRVSFRQRSEFNDRIWTGEDAASALTGIAKPDLLRSFRWLDPSRDIVWRADELTYADGPLISVTPEIAKEPVLPDQWWAELGKSLASLQAVRTTRVGVRQNLVDRRLREFAGELVDPAVDEWCTAHADLHWANLTAPRLCILDWEGWGSGPRGLDAATLWAFSLQVPAVAGRVQAEFADGLASRSGKISQLFMCIELLRMVENHGDHPGLEAPLRRSAGRLVEELSQRR